MIVVDTSALLSILQEEPDARAYADAIAEADPALLSAASLAEAGIVMLNRHGPKGLESCTYWLKKRTSGWKA